MPDFTYRLATIEDLDEEFVDRQRFFCTGDSPRSCVYTSRKGGVAYAVMRSDDKKWKCRAFCPFHMRENGVPIPGEDELESARRKSTKKESHG